MRACEHSLVSLSLWRLEVNLRCCSSDAVHLVYRDRFSYWPGAHPAVELSVWPVGHFCFHLPSTGITSAATMPKHVEKSHMAQERKQCGYLHHWHRQTHSKGFPPPLQSQDCPTRGQAGSLALTIVDPLRTSHSAAPESVHLPQVRRTLLVWGPSFEIQ